MANIIRHQLTRANGLPVLPFVKPYLTVRTQGDIFEFSKIVPDPAFKTKEICLANGETIEVYDETHEESKIRSKWYHKNWGSHSNGLIISVCPKVIVFETKWSPAIHIIQKLADIYDVSFQLEWTDIDDFGCDSDGENWFPVSVGLCVFTPTKRKIPIEILLSQEQKVGK